MESESEELGRCVHLYICRIRAVTSGRPVAADAADADASAAVALLIETEFIGSA